ncbi:Peptidase S24-like [Paracoccus alcaliphilus]|uniref:Peptidase S24-like n=2 Tax=Paracoccus alcaliphilus TaxID=34002 RepID=A0A1H8KBJ8_9RHOB|nr:S24 family peptidase [Paracoccus alcaliphilus]SEN90304.1 Peptidase S24-like [Paracoccus alcaliphilus]
MAELLRMGQFPHMENTDLDAFVRGLEVAMKRTGWKAAPLSEASGMGTTAVRDLFRKKSSPKVSTAFALASTIGMTVDEIIRLGEGAPSLIGNFIPVIGEVGAGARVPLTDVHENNGGMFSVAAPSQLLRRAPASTFAAVIVSGDSMMPMYQPGDILFYSRATHEGIPDEDIGRPCVVEDATGMAWLKQVRTGDEPGLFHLISLNPNADTMHNQRIKWASRVIFALPEDMVERI